MIPRSRPLISAILTCLGIYMLMTLLMLGRTVYDETKDTSLTLGPVDLKGHIATAALQPPRRPLFLLSFSSSGRSGSTLMTEFLSALEDSIVFFEPMFAHQFTGCVTNLTCTEEYVRRIFNCEYDENFEPWLRKKLLFIKYFNKETRACLHDKKTVKECLKPIDLRSLCRRAQTRIIKIIRGRLSAMEPMMRDPEVNLKVIFLTRDIRAALLSIEGMGWGHNETSHCNKIESDQLAYQELSLLYPDSVMHLKLEDFSIDPFGKAEEIMTFIFGNSKIPKQLNKFLMDHMTSRSRMGSMTTYKNSSEVYDLWRYKIKEERLRIIEEEPSCARSILRMGHTIFGSLQRARNSSIPLFT